MKLRLLSSALFSVLAVLAGGAATEDADEALPQVPEERPRLDLPWDAHPYRPMPYRSFDPWYNWGYYPYGAFYPHRFGYRSDLYYNTMYGFFPEPGHSELSVSIGSDDYFGTSISHSGFVSRKHNITYNVAALWETGETYWNHYDYDSFTVAPTFFWNNENTFVYVGFEYTETEFENENMSPFRVGNEHDNSGSFQKIRVRQPSDYIEKRASVGLEHDINDVLTIGVHFEATDLDRKRPSGRIE